MNYINKLEIENKILVDYSSECDTRKVKLHTFCIFKLKNYSGYYYFEHAHKKRRGIHVYWDLNDLYKERLRYIDTNRILTEIPEIPVGYSLDEFREYINPFEPIDKEKKNKRR